MESIELKALLREGTGKQVVHKLRAAGFIPATLYGVGHDPVSLQVAGTDLERIFRGHSGSIIINLSVDNADPVMTIIREHQKHPVSGNVLHMDFQRISMDKPIHVSVPVVLTGESPGVKDLGGILEHSLRQVEMSCLPAEIPPEIVVDISELQLNESIHVKDLNLDKYDVLTDLERTIAAVNAPRIVKEEEAEVEEGEEAAEAEAEAEGEGEGEGKGKGKAAEETSAKEGDENKKKD